MSNTLTALALAVASAYAVSPAQALTYTTSGEFAPPGAGGDTTLDFDGDGTLTFASITGTDIGLPSIIGLARFSLSGLTDTPSTVPAGSTFTLTIDQSDPAAAPYVLTATVGSLGAFSASGGVLFLDFAVTTFDIGPLTYTLTNVTPAGRLFIPVQSAGGLVTLEALVVPEPSALVLMGVGLVGAAGYGYRRRRLAEVLA